MDGFFESGAGPTELCILRQLSAYKDELIRRLRAKVWSLRKRLAELETTAAKSPRVGSKRASSVSSASSRIHTPRGLATKGACNTGRLAPAPPQSVRTASPRCPLENLKLRPPHSAVLKRTSSEVSCVSGPSCQPQSSRGPNPGGTGLLKLNSSLMSNCTPKPLHISKNSSSSSVSSKASHLAFGKTRVPAAGINRANHHFVAQPCIQEFQHFSKEGDNVRPMQSSKQTPNLSIPQVDIARLQKLAASAQRLSDYSYRGGASSVTKQTANPVSSAAPMRVPEHTGTAVKLQISGQSSTKSGHGRVSILSSRSTCSSVSSRRRPWD